MPSATIVRPSSQLAVSSGFKSAWIDANTTSYIISPRSVGVIICVFLFKERYLILTSLLSISALVALVPIPLPFICALRSSSSISCPAFSIASIIEPELYLFGGEVSPSLISAENKSISMPFFNCFIFSMTFLSSLLSLSSASSALPSVVCACLSVSFCFAKEALAIARYPSFVIILKLAKNDSLSLSAVIFILRYSADG